MSAILTKSVTLMDKKCQFLFFYNLPEGYNNEDMRKNTQGILNHSFNREEPRTKGGEKESKIQIPDFQGKILQRGGIL